jgi:guanylate kinase
MSLVYIISAPSGSGKTTLVAELRKSVQNLDFSVSYTTRAPRGSEHNGKEYYFVSREEFDRMLAHDDFLEHAEVFGQCYGTAKRFLREAQACGNDLLLDIDVQGAAQIKAKIPGAVSIFVLPPSREELEARLKRRSAAEGVTSPEIIERRLHAASQEIVRWPQYDYILVNDRLERSIDQLKAIVLCERTKHAGEAAQNKDPLFAAHCREAQPCLKQNMAARVEPILASFQLAGAPVEGEARGMR